MMKKREFVKKVYAVIMAMAITICIALLSDTFCIISASDGENYDIDRAEFLFEFEDNGDVYITEQWNINSVDDDFSGVSRQIHYTKNRLESFDEIDVISYSVNGKIASSSLCQSDTESFSDKEYVIECLADVSGEPGSYEIKYLLKNVVKIDKSGHAFFRWSFTDERIRSLIGEVNVAFNISPENVVWHYDNCKSQNGNNFTDVSMPLSCDVKMNPDAFPNARRVDADFEWVDLKGVTNNIIKEPITLKLVLLVIVCVVAVLGLAGRFIFFYFIGVLSFNKSIKNKKIDKKIASCQEKLKESADRLEKTRIPFMWFLLIPEYKREWKNHIITFYLEILELYRHRRIVLEKDRLIIKNDNFSYTEDPEQRKIDDKFIGLLKSNFIYSTVGTDDVITFDDLCLTLKKESNRSVFFGSLEVWGIDYSCTLKSIQLYQKLEREGQIVQIENDLKLWKKFCERRERNVRTCVRILQDSTEISYYTVLENVLGYRTLACDVGRGESNLHTFCNLESVRDTSDTGALLSRFCSSGGEDIPKRKLR